MGYMETLGERAKKASYELAVLDTATKNQMLERIAEYLVENEQEIIEQNKLDIAKAKDNGITDTMVDRLMLNSDRIKGIAQGVREIIALEDPIGVVQNGAVRPNGLRINKVTVPLGVIGIIFESRPNVTVDAAALCIKAGSSTILRGGKEAINSNIALCKVMRKAIESCGLNPDIVNLVEDTSRDIATEMMRLNKYIDVLIPRGGSGLINAVVENASVPVIETGVGNCHIYVDKYADLKMATDIVFNAKTSRPSVCNACESMLVHTDIANEFLPMVKAKLDEKNVKIYGCEKTKAILGDCVIQATQEDYAKEYLDYAISVKVVDSDKNAIDHINKFGTGHSEAIITNDINTSTRFTDAVDAAAVYVNASTRFTDGGEFGFGAEIGISTQKLHARGPMGLKELTSIKYIVSGNGQIR